MGLTVFTADRHTSRYYRATKTAFSGFPPSWPGVPPEFPASGRPEPGLRPPGTKSSRNRYSRETKGRWKTPRTCDIVGDLVPSGEVPMSEAYAIEPMPREVRAARMFMWFQTATGLLGLVLAVIIVNTMNSGDDLLFPLVLLGLNIFFPVATGALAIGCSSRRKWVRTAVFIVEGLRIADHLSGLFLGFNVAILLGLVLSVLVIVRLSNPAAMAWFSR
ncbi:hypothetical protein [Streptosporangium sp. NPDC051022]|uniref:hypothetical protein n=1 Tax=Streptosporangium sp. NPDC051022 TaxID=3155752 RepID=UPI00342BA331